MMVRIAAVAAIVLAVSGVATATATYVVRRVWPRPAVLGAGGIGEDERAQRSRAGRRGAEGRRERSAIPSLEAPSPAETAGARQREPAVEVAAASAKIATASADRPAALRAPMVRTLAARRSDGPTTPPARPPEGISPAPAQLTEPPTLPTLPLPANTPPINTTSPSSIGRAPPQVRVDGVAQEAGLLRQALFALRRDHDARRALALLDDYDRSFGQGTLAPEATSARAQALLQLGDNARALELLDRLPLWDQGYTGELRVIRGELRSLSGRCREAVLDFDTVLRAQAGTAPDEVARALFGRASCRARTGDLPGAEEDRQRYLRQFPQGPAARQLSSPP